MKPYFTLLFSLLFVPNLLIAEDGASAPTKAVTIQEIAVIRPVVDADMLKHIISNKRKFLFQEAMHLDEVSKEPFWIIYDAYEKEKAALAEKRIRLLADYLDEGYAMTDKQMKDILKRSHANQKKDLSIRMKYTNKITKALNAHIASRFYQVDDIITSTIRLSILANLPFFEADEAAPSK